MAWKRDGWKNVSESFSTERGGRWSVGRGGGVCEEDILCAVSAN